MTTLLPRPLSRAIRTIPALVAGPADRRHRALADLSRRWNLHRLRLAVDRLRRGDSDRPVILVSLLDHLGDLVAAEPIVRHLRRTRPEALILWVVGRRYRELVESNPDIDGVLTLGCTTEWIRLVRSGIGPEVVDLHINGRACSVCREYYARDANPSGIDISNYYHHGNLLRVFCKVAGLPEIDDGPRLSIPDRCREAVSSLDLPGGYVAIHCTSNQVVRDWDDLKWRELATRAVGELGLPVIEVGLRPVVSGTVPGVIDHCGRHSILETAEILRRASLFIGIDSGPAHLANAVGTPGVILLGHYRSYRRYMPYSGGYADGTVAMVIQADGPAASIPVETAFEAVASRLGRSDRSIVT